MNQTVASIALGASLIAGSAFAGEAAWDKTFAPSDKVIHQKVSYPNRYGITVSADLYVPKDMNRSKKHAALVVGTPYGGVKEQGAGIYAQVMAERGFVTIAFDESYSGESGGNPRHVSSPDIFVEDFSAGVDYLGTQPFVDRRRIGAIGICGSGGFALTAAQVDRRIKAVATASMYDMSRVIRLGWKDTMTEEQRNRALDELGEQRWADFASQTAKLNPCFPAAIPDEGPDPITREFFEYYVAPRGHHPRSIGGFTATSSMTFMNFQLMSHLPSISPRPILLIVGGEAHSRYFSEDAYKMAAEPKELYVVPHARHIDLYDRMDMIPFDKLTAFFQGSLK